MCYTIRIISHRSCTFRGHLRSTGQFRYITCTLPSMRCACITSVTSTWFVALQISWPVNDLLNVLLLWLLDIIPWIYAGVFVWNWSFYAIEVSMFKLPPCLGAFNQQEYEITFMKPCSWVMREGQKGYRQGQRERGSPYRVFHRLASEGWNTHGMLMEYSWNTFTEGIPWVFHEYSMSIPWVFHEYSIGIP